LPGVKTNDSRADRRAIEGEEIKERRVRVPESGIRVDWIVGVFKIDEIFRGATAVVIVSGVKDAIGPTKFSRVTEAQVERGRSVGACVWAGRWRR
jgi:hypothetical protein